MRCVVDAHCSCSFTRFAPTGAYSFSCPVCLSLQVLVGLNRLEEDFLGQGAGVVEERVGDTGDGPPRFFVYFVSSYPSVLICGWTVWRTAGTFRKAKINQALLSLARLVLCLLTHPPFPPPPFTSHLDAVDDGGG